MRTPFLTALAPMAAVRGSRDPLGLQPIWSRMGRTLVHNVTTVSGDLRGWTTLLLATAVAGSLVDEGSVPEEGFTDALLRFEQVVAYAREKYDPDRGEGVRGILGVRARLKQHDPHKLPLGQGDEARILGNQQATGVWGQIASPARSSDLLDTRHMRLHSPAADAVQALYLIRLTGPHHKALRQLLVDERSLDRDGAHADLLAALGSMHAPKLTVPERSFYRTHVLYAGRASDDIQARLIQTWLDCGADRAVNAAEVAALAEAASRLGHEDVRGALEAIRRAETLLAPAEHLFAFLLTRDRQPLAAVLADVQKRWTAPLAEIAPDAVDLALPHFVDAYGARLPEGLLRSLAEALTAGAWERAVDAVIALNAWVSDRRGGAPWLVVQDGRLQVRMQDEPSDLPANPAQLSWVHSYYLEPLRRLVVAVEGRQA